ncbi:MAG: enoyl-CoA hydratase-related protein [Saprospiraceae bacterium]
MEYQNLLIEIDENQILTLTINRPNSLNALNSQTISELEHFFGKDAPSRTDIKGIILTGAGEKAFVAGADIKEFLGLDEDGGARLAQKGQNVFFMIEQFPKPVIAVVNGFALGGGCELAMSCHMRIAAENAKFGQPEVNLGLIPGYGGTQRLIQYIGKGKAMELLMTADMIGADEAHKLGLANHVAPAGEAISKAKEILKKISTKGPVAIAKIVETVNAYFDKNQDGFAREVLEFGNTTKTEDFREGAGAFVEKRKADFKGR